MLPGCRTSYVLSEHGLFVDHRLPVADLQLFQQSNGGNVITVLGHFPALPMLAELMVKRSPGFPARSVLILDRHLVLIVELHRQ